MQCSVGTPTTETNVCPVHKKNYRIKSLVRKVLSVLSYCVILKNYSRIYPLLIIIADSH